MGLRSGGFGKPKEMPMNASKGASKDGKPMDKMSEGKHIHVHSHGGKIHSHSTDEHGMQMDNEHASADDASEHVRNFLNEGDQQSSGDDNSQPEPARHFGLMA